MEPLTIFAATVGFVGAFHLLTQTVERFGTRNAAPRQGKREDWYCFFSPADLLGEERAETRDQQQRISEAEELEQRRRQQANRPRLQA